MDELRCEGPCVGRNAIGAIWEVVLFLAVSGCFGVSSSFPFSGYLGERVAPFQLRHIGWSSGSHSGCVLFEGSRARSL